MDRTSLRKLLYKLVALCVFVGIPAGVFAQDKDWRPVTPVELSAKPVVEPDADAEAIFWEVRVDDSSAEELALKNYVRVKIFTERGREQFSKHDIVFTKGTKVKNVEARVTKPDGSTVFLKPEDVLERDIIKASGVKVKAKSFALPGLEIGSIIEYRYKEVYDNASANMRLTLQHEVPVQTISYYVKPYPGMSGMNFEPFNTSARFEKDKNGFHRVTMTNVPAFHEEPSMVAEDEAKSWIYIYYVAPGTPSNPNEYWRDTSKLYYDASKEWFKVNDEVKRVTAEAINGATTDDEKLKRLYNWAKLNIKNLNYADKASDEEWKNARKATTPGETLKLKYGSSIDIDNLFAAMAKAAGFDPRKALSGDRDELTFDRNVANRDLMINSYNIAIKIGDKWRFFKPGNYFASYGMLTWSDEGQIALIADPKEPIWAAMDFAPAEKSRETRTGKFKLLPDGTLEGEGRIEYTGHRAALIKNYNRNASDSERENRLKDVLKSSIMGTVEVENYTIENLSDPEKPVIYKFKIKVPGYASRTGKRIFFQPNVFERSSKPRFTAGTRKYDVSISYPYSEKDDITIELPQGFALENADAPGSLRDKQGIGVHSVKMGVTADNKELVYAREFSFGNGGLVRFPSASYPAVKGLFEAFNKADVHQLTLRESASVSATSK